VVRRVLVWDIALVVAALARLEDVADDIDAQELEERVPVRKVRPRLSLPERLPGGVGRGRASLLTDGDT
jgi:hypothetical protein